MGMAEPGGEGGTDAGGAARAPVIDTSTGSDLDAARPSSMWCGVARKP